MFGEGEGGCTKEDNALKIRECLGRLGEEYNLISVEYIEKQLHEVPVRYRLQYLKTVLGEVAPSKAIKMQCYSCVGWADVKNAIVDCRGITCPLYAYRPYKCLQK